MRPNTRENVLPPKNVVSCGVGSLPRNFRGRKVFLNLWLFKCLQGNASRGSAEIVTRGLTTKSYQVLSRSWGISRAPARAAPAKALTRCASHNDPPFAFLGERNSTRPHHKDSESPMISHATRTEIQVVKTTGRSQPSYAGEGQEGLKEVRTAAAAACWSA